ncbi:GerAB/ArcD/ProY family transporter [Pseudoneobacillus sp. C159]
MEQRKDKIGMREYFAILILTIGVKLSDDTPSLLYDKILNGAWMAPLITGILAIIPLYFLIRVISIDPQKSLIDQIQSLLGKYIGYFVILGLWMILLSFIVIDTAIYTDIIGTMYFTRTPTIVIYIMLMMVSAFGARMGLEQIGSVAWAVLPYVKFSLFVALALTVVQGQLPYIFPIFGPGKWEIVKESGLKLSIYGDFLFFGFIATYISNQNAYKKGSWLALAVLALELSFSFFAFLILFDYESVKLLNYPFHESIRYISVGFITNVETFFFPFWIVTSFVRFAVYLYLTGVLFGWLFRINNFEYAIPSLATIIVFLGLLPDSPTFTLSQIRESLLDYVLTPAFFILPSILWGIAKLKGEFKNEKNNP